MDHNSEKLASFSGKLTHMNSPHCTAVEQWTQKSMVQASQGQTSMDERKNSPGPEKVDTPTAEVFQ